MTIYRKSGGFWGTGSFGDQLVWVKKDGVWQQAKNGWVKDAGTWKQFLYEIPKISYSGSYSTTTSGGNTYMYLTGSGTLTVAEHPLTNVSALLVGGGGGGGAVADRTAGGGGGGGVWAVSGRTISRQSHAVYIGAGGTGGSTTSYGTNGGITYTSALKNDSGKIYVASGGGAGGGGKTGFFTTPSVGASPSEDVSYIYSASSGGGGFHYSNQAGASGTYSGGNGWDVFANPPFLFAAGGGGGYSSAGENGFTEAPPGPGYTIRYNHAGAGGEGYTFSPFGDVYSYGGGGGLEGSYGGIVGSTYWDGSGKASGGDPANPTHGQGGWFYTGTNLSASAPRANSGGGGGGGGGPGGYGSTNGASGVIVLYWTTGAADIV